jgi:hypothetical protein
MPVTMPDKSVRGPSLGSWYHPLPIDDDLGRRTNVGYSLGAGAPHVLLGERPRTCRNLRPEQSQLNGPRRGHFVYLRSIPALYL